MREHCNIPNTDAESAWRQIAQEYFDGLTDETQEAALAAYLAAYQGTDSELLEAKAVMSYFAAEARAIAEPLPSRERGATLKAWDRIHKWALTIPAAAVIALLFAIWSPQSECYASVGGKKINDKEAVLAIMETQLSEISKTSAENDQNIAENLSILAEQIDL